MVMSIHSSMRTNMIAMQRMKVMIRAASGVMSNRQMAVGSSQRPTALVVAIDGPAGAGKGTLAKRLAKELSFAYLDTGLMFRAVGWQAHLQAVDFTDEDKLEAISLNLTPEQLDLPELRSDQAAQAASKVSTLPRVRAALLTSQRSFAHTPPGGEPGSVLDGRDIGTNVCPDAPVKLYITADVDVRAERRVKDLEQRGIQASFSQVQAEMIERDRRDSQRAAAPLRPADDAIIIDTSNLSPEEVFRVAISHVEAASKKLES